MNSDFLVLLCWFFVGIFLVRLFYRKNIYVYPNNKNLDNIYIDENNICYKYYMTPCDCY